MATPAGRRHWPEKSGYLDSSNARAGSEGSASAAASAMAAKRHRLVMAALLSYFWFAHVQTARHGQGSAARVKGSDPPDCAVRAPTAQTRTRSHLPASARLVAPTGVRAANRVSG